MKIHHLNCGRLHAPPSPPACCHCLLLESAGGLVLIDTGIGLKDVQRPLERIGRPLIDIAGFQFNEADTAVRQIEAMGLDPLCVTDIVLTHADPDHTGGLADFPNARVHISHEEHASLTTGMPPMPFPRYLPQHFDHQPNWHTYPASSERWFDLEARRVNLRHADCEVHLVPLIGHTWGHCGVAVREGGRWLLHVGDAYYLRAELDRDDHPVSALARHNAVDDSLRVACIERLRGLARDHAELLDMIGYHDIAELPAHLHQRAAPTIRHA